MKKYILALLILFSTATANAQIEGFFKVRIDDFWGGQNSKDTSEVIEVNQCASCVNVVINKKGEVSKRKGQLIFNTDVGSTFFRGVGRFDPDSSTSYMVIASGQTVMRSEVSDTSWTYASLASVEGHPLSAGYNTEFIQANDLLFVMNGQDYTDWYNGSIWYNGLGHAQGSPPTATTAAWLRNYLFMAGNPTQPDWVYFSNNIEPEKFTVTDLFRVNTGDGQVIKKLMAFRLYELIVYKERSIYVLDIDGSTPLTDWSLQPISTSVGTPAPRSVVNLGNDQWFLSSNPIAIRSLARSDFDKILVNMVSQPIQDIFDGTAATPINKSKLSLAAAVLFDNKYILAIPTGSSTVNDLVLIFDFMTEGWYQIQGWYPSAWIVYDERLFYTDANDGRVIEVFKNTIGDYTRGPTTTTLASVPTVSIGFSYITKVLDFDNPENFKQIDDVELEFDTTGNYTATLLINLDNNGWTDVGTVNLAGNVVTLPVNLPFTLTSAGVARKTYQLEQYGEFKKIQLKVDQNGISENIKLRRMSIFGRIKKWRRE